MIDLLNPTARRTSGSRGHLSISIPTAEEMANSSRPRSSITENNARYMTARVICQSDTDVPKLADVTFILTEKPRW